MLLKVNGLASVASDMLDLKGDATSTVTEHHDMPP